MNIIITYDDNLYNSKLCANHGFSCIIKHPERTILFDTGGDGEILLGNMGRLGIIPGEIDAVFLSHVHHDHVGGLVSFLNRNSIVTVYLPASFPQSLKDEIQARGAKLEEVSRAEEIIPGIFTTGELDGVIKEQSLIVRSPSGLVVITGCAHPGVVKIIRTAKDKVPSETVYLVIGGFHLLEASSAQIQTIISSFMQLVVTKVAPCHCSGEETRKLFQEQYGKDYIEIGVGKRIAL